MTTEAPVNPRLELLLDSIKEQYEVAVQKGGNIQVLVDFKVCNGRLVGEANFDMKHRVDLQSR